MKIVRIDLDDDVKPVRIMAELSIEEAAWISKTCGSLSPAQHRAASQMSSDLNTAVFNPYWEDGVDGCLRGDTE